VVFEVVGEGVEAVFDEIVMAEEVVILEIV
jgi:hypothetical protein